MSIKFDKSNTWNDIDWNKTQNSVRKIQHRIYKARLDGNLKRVYWLQNFLINNFGAKLMAVRQVTTLNKGRKTAGVDKKVVTTAEQKYRMALALKLDGKALPIRRVWILKPGKAEKRPLGIPVILDRAKQALAKLALEPEWEAVFEPNSYGFRPGRSALDAIEAIYESLHFNTPKWVYDADIRKCFDRIDHEALLSKLQTFPLMQRQVTAWLKAGVFEGYANTGKDTIETTAGTPQGGVISPLLANITMYGLENHLKNFAASLPMKPHPGANRGSVAKKKAISVIRYADDFVLIHRNKVILELCIVEAKKWLVNVGLEVSEENSQLRDIRRGFLFLGFQIIQVRKPKVGTYKVKIRPSKQSQEKFLAKIRDLIQRNKAVSAFDLISMLRPVIIGWTNYFKYCECKEVFSKLTHLISQKLRAWVFRRDTRNGRLVVKQKYFPSGRTYQFDGRQHKDEWILVGRKKSKDGEMVERYLPHAVWVRSLKHVKVQGTQTPYNLDEGIYWANRSAIQSP
jgi:RNA-directed DNA polymerase